MQVQGASARKRNVGVWVNSALPFDLKGQKKSEQLALLTHTAALAAPIRV